MRAIHAEVSGLVQGVYFRTSTASEARHLGLAGWVRNLPTGSVEVWAQGPNDAVDRLELFLQRGPRRAIVEKVSTEEVEPDSRMTSFNVR
ncbi:MAG: acylphosphatase [Actinomycetota bacterium]